MKHRTIIATSYATALRCNELSHLMAGDIDNQKMALHVREGKSSVPRDIPLSPFCFYLVNAPSLSGRILGATSQSTQRSSVSLHLEDWLENASYVYIAPEAIGNRNIRDEVSDIFSLGALAFHIFSNQPPAPNLRELHETLAQHHCFGPAHVPL